MRMNRMWMLAAGAAGVALIAAACGGGNGYGGSSATSTSAPAAVVPTAATNLAGGAQDGAAAKMAVTAHDFSFDPTTLKADKGANVEITFTNGGAATHTFTVYSDEEYTKPVAGGDSGRVAGGGTATITFAAGDSDLYFRCEIHPTQMMGEISVD